ncbi:MAG: acyl-CoA thioesterase [Gammaproteobacteria bacterium]|nr:acyl-CoA thioesterase [Gammaproteobacteria bacterium]
MDDNRGLLTIQTLAMPGDTNANGDIFGGWLVSQMDLAAGVLSKSIAKGRVATVAINALQFLKPVHVGDIVSCFCRLDKKGRTSMHIIVEVWTENFHLNTTTQAAIGTFVFVAIDEEGKPREVPID